MKFKRAFLLSVFLFVLLTNVIEIGAVNTGFQTQEMPKEETDGIASRIDLVRIDQEPPKKFIKCFDVNPDGFIAVGEEDERVQEQKTVCIYTEEGVFQYGYTFHTSGTFEVEWDEENLNIYFVRGGLIVSVTPGGEILDVLDVPDTMENSSYINHFIRATERTKGDAVYCIRKNVGLLNWFTSSYSQVIVKDAAGEERILYDVSSTQLPYMIVIIMLGCVFFGITFVVAVQQSDQWKRGKGTSCRP